MQKIGILNSDIAKVLADLGHTDTIVIGDCGLPVPARCPQNRSGSETRYSFLFRCPYRSAEIYGSRKNTYRFRNGK